MECPIIIKASLRHLQGLCKHLATRCELLFEIPVINQLDYVYLEPSSKVAGNPSKFTKISKLKNIKNAWGKLSKV